MNNLSAQGVEPASAVTEPAAPTYSDILAAAARIAPHAHATPVMRSRVIDEAAGCELHFKCENLQRGGAFKFRGACNAVFSLSDEEVARGIVTQSSGNHGGAIALAARLRGGRATVVAPHNTPKVKLAAIRAYGADIVHCEPEQSARDAATAQVLARTGGVLVHPFNDARVIAGQGTATLELLASAPQLDTVIAPVSGGGLLSGTAIAAHGHDPSIAVYGAEPEGARDAHDSLHEGRRITGRKTDTICDGLRAELGTLTFPILRSHLRDICLVDDRQVVAAMRLIWERMKLVVEPSGAVPLAVVLAYPALFAGRRVGLIVSGGNVDLDLAAQWFAPQTL
ncbi:MULTISPECIES: pyridoxal-phosphate dependent enzyme [unclassified Lysobacter]|uniref:pyridoxal-phosphate dependent enzyme n=1 Tax=unclassified Lysobacter TaxID=2635362 RepID=UPI001BE7ACD7|nr:MULTISPECIES: pyridoxal-phosphate dependent enzyme [unclassified Lysobacter]MBT2749248.1 pyridoxal-phosphate dependent enzyme [Lysobacter sp. ISL-42]MBT2754209.1 pyridoxal-phosphate dependent enzyme [Lysobacter sp. ISL-50]MBT2779583.1 pyridoxal-phosphate dependent enzyme [Lysobacter sp. ISL-54]MBT2784709.1 pyridoxal-phosphate dependent enzyme [Lysobacter sp. ISL-52]